MLAIMPTGGGKSLCFQLPALVMDRLVVVISPLIALMRDQVAALRAAGIEAGAITSAHSEEEISEVYDALGAGRLRLLYLAPERLANPGMRLVLEKTKPVFLAVDEAHCVSEWGHDFRPDYLRISALRRALGVPLAAFTATADAETRADIRKKLFDAEPQEFLFGFDRPNIHLRFEIKNQPRKQLLELLGARAGQSGIIYAATRAKCETLALALTAEGHKALFYHAGMDPDQRRAAEARFQSEDGLVMVATVAFGMGIDKPDIRFVIHADLPKSMESYYQEIGRAGRDGAPAEAITLYGADDIRFRRMQIDEGLGDAARRDIDHGRLNALLGLAEAQSCRRQVLLGFFGEESATCGNCDHCCAPPKLIDGTEPVRMALSAILRSEERFGAGHLIDILRGQSTEKIQAKNHHLLPTFGIGAARSKSEWLNIFRQMMGLDLIRPDAGRYGALRMTQKARPLLKGKAIQMLRADEPARRKDKPPAKSLISEEDEPLFAALKAQRRALAEAQKTPAYIVFSDAVLMDMVRQRPTHLDEFARLSGVGAKKLARYGDIFLSVLNDHVPPLHPTRRKLAGHASGAIFDQLQFAARELERGATGLEKPLSCSTSQLAQIAKHRPKDIAALSRILDARRLDRFGEVFLSILKEE